MDSARLLQSEGQDVVASAGDGENHIIRLYFQEARIGPVIFPGEGVDVAVVEAFVLFKGFVVVDAPVVVLIPTILISIISKNE